MGEFWQQKYTQRAPFMNMKCDKLYDWIKNLTQNGEPQR